MSVNIYVGNLSYEMTENKLNELFSVHGAVSSAKIITDQYTGGSKGFGFIEMKERREADNAINDLNGKNILNRELKVNIAKPKTNNWN
ncbi:RNA-binding protein [Leptospira sp. 2 VSF19]|uniref:RNA-binding protein n=1 Tax=Leptospira soteropolitanensis TaxID=2950025 RepID=A0AAW5VTZ6_9LEPT|nr:RNA-binding protein [Leptospira soteropolitanensis]MCW7494609.1 RNA-binding protein [Leptospira soteropolitanensis]MCW7502223.1 RNA-binding protein [Leptospira soteropolitanensis]MCW7524455.1 RNA-binding protein [Leptospira soteropolitanensis]MCW7528321.1 RNA-binding protein [Leptospira soteropolitanensis]MCW7532174.1 RNA-binding protein [Leptospira soteropolitanensis]